jgi:hypothetical protein
VSHPGLLLGIVKDIYNKLDVDNSKGDEGIDIDHYGMHHPHQSDGQAQVPETERKKPEKLSSVDVDLDQENQPRFSSGKTVGPLGGKVVFSSMQLVILAYNIFVAPSPG